LRVQHAALQLDRVELSAHPGHDMRAFVAGIAAIICFAVVAGVYAWTASISMLLVYAIIALAVLVAIYSAGGGRAWFGTHEHPEQIMGARLRFGDIEWHPTLRRLPDAIVREWDGGQYRIEFVEPLPTPDEVRYALITPRHVGYPVSRVRTWRSVIVNGSLESSGGFIGVVRLA
jgi:hypothetical protein